MFEGFRRLVSADPGAPAMIDGATGSIVTRAGLLALAEMIQIDLAVFGPHHGDLVAIRLPNSPDFVASFLAVLTLDLTALPIDRDASDAEVARLATHFDVRAVLHFSPSHAAGDKPEVRIPLSGKTRPDLDPEIVLVKLSSGSTGLPRGILTSEENLIADSRQICSTMQIASDDRNFGAIPLSHSYGFSNLVMPLLTQGTPIVYSNDYAARSILEIANGYGVTVVPGIPMMFEHLGRLPESDGRFETVRTFISAGAPLPADVSRRFTARFGVSVHSFYGCSECGGIAYDRVGGAIESGSVGAAMDGVDLSLEPKTGRMVVRSGAVAAGGYLSVADADHDRFVDGAFRTDDLARFGTGGELELVGRMSDIINAAGRKVNPREVERVILEIDGVREAKVYGEPAGARGDVVAVAVVASPDVTREQIRAHCRAHLSTHKVPRIVKFIDQIPFDDRGKVKRAALVAL